MSRTWSTTPPPTHPFAGSSKARQEVGKPGHCERCAKIGHVLAHRNLGCGDVGCFKAHSPDNPADQPVTMQPSTANLLAMTSYAGADMSRKVTALHRMIGERHGPVVARDGLRAICPSCRTTGGRQHPFPCPTWVDTSLIFGWTYPARMFEAFGVQVPAGLIEVPAVEGAQ